MGTLLDIDLLKMHLKNLIMYTSGLPEDYEKRLDGILDPIQLWVEVHRRHEFNIAGEMPPMVKKSWDYYQKIKKDMEKTVRI